MVGTAPKELESLNELIKFDHVYFKSEPSTLNALPQLPVAMETHSQDSGVAPVMQNSGNTQDYNTDSHAPENVISIKDFESLESLLSEDWISMVTDNCNMISKDKFTGAAAPQRQAVDCSTKARSPATSSSLNNVHLDSKKLAPGITDNMGAGSMSDSGFSDYSYSDAGSPSSVGSSVLSEDVWEESFGELFPCLL
jgi:hypothetical protein